MNPKTSGVLLGTIVLATFITAALVYPDVGNARLAFGPPVVLLVLFGLWALLPTIDPLNKGFVGFRYIYDFFWILLLATLAYAYALKLGEVLGWQVDIFHTMVPVIAVLIFIVGAMLPWVKRNWFFGIRTPWSLSSDAVWKETHRLGSKLFMLAGVLIFIGTFTSRAWSIGLIVVPILGGALVSIVYSYFVYSRQMRG
ncbi:MAG: SdpI family protein [Minisyncoccia bacterium]